jgi:hypothetical protein
MARNNRRFGPADRAEVITQLLAGATVAAAARAAGFAVQTLYDDRARCPLFARAWADAVAESGRPRLVERGTGGWWQLKRLRRNRFTRARKEAFLSTLAGTCEVGEAARAAGVCRATAYAHRVSDPAFAAGWRQALTMGVQLLQARLLKERRDARAELEFCPLWRAGPEPAQERERDLEFWRMMHLLREHKRGLAGTPDRRPRGRRPGRWSFEETIARIEKGLAAFEVRAARRRKWGTPRSQDP